MNTYIGVDIGKFDLYVSHEGKVNKIENTAEALRGVHRTTRQSHGGSRHCEPRTRGAAIS